MRESATSPTSYCCLSRNWTTLVRLATLVLSSMKASCWVCLVLTSTKPCASAYSAAKSPALTLCGLPSIYLHFASSIFEYASAISSGTVCSVKCQTRISRSLSTTSLKTEGEVASGANGCFKMAIASPKWPLARAFTADHTVLKAAQISRLDSGTR